MRDANSTAPKHISDDPVYYITVAFFTLLTTALPAILGQPRFLPIIQTVALTTFIVIALHNGNVRGALQIMALWLSIQFIVVVVLTSLFLSQVEYAFADGFVYRAAIATWFFGGTPHPSTFTTNPLAFLTEFLGIVLGAMATAGVIGIWFLVRMLNLAAYGTGALLATLPNPTVAFLVIPYWTLIRAAGYAGLTIVSAMPLLTYQWSPQYYWRAHRRLILTSLALIVLGIIVEFVLIGRVIQPAPN